MDCRRGFLIFQVLLLFESIGLFLGFRLKLFFFDKEQKRRIIHITIRIFHSFLVVGDFTADRKGSVNVMLDLVQHGRSAFFIGIFSYFGIIPSKIFDILTGFISKHKFEFPAVIFYFAETVFKPISDFGRGKNTHLIRKRFVFRIGQLIDIVSKGFFYAQNRFGVYRKLFCRSFGFSKTQFSAVDFYLERSFCGINMYDFHLQPRFSSILQWRDFAVGKRHEQSRSYYETKIFLILLFRERISFELFPFIIKLFFF